jgi:Ca-activated chloride channel family protein
MKFSHSEYFWLLLILIPIGWRVLSTERFLDRLRRHFRADINGRSPWRLTGRCLLPLLALTCLATALAGPRIMIMRAGDISDNLVIAVGIDVSKSMLAEDVVLEKRSRDEQMPLSNRLNAARRFALTLFEHLGGEKVGLFFFARNGIEVVSPTRDVGFLRYMTTHTDLGDLTESGSNLIAAIDSGMMMVDSQQHIPAKAVIIVTDGEDTENDRPAILQTLSRDFGTQTPVFTVGVGRTNDVFIPIRRKGSADIDGFYMDNQDIPLKTRQVPQTLEEISAATGGTYFDLDRNNPAKVADKLMQKIATTAAEPVDLPPRRAPFDLSPLFLLASLIFYIPFILL